MGGGGGVGSGRAVDAPAKGFFVAARTPLPGGKMGLDTVRNPGGFQLAPINLQPDVGTLPSHWEKGWGAGARRQFPGQGLNPAAARNPLPGGKR
jgi:hypothetical protein